MKKFLFGVLITVVILLVYKQSTEKSSVTINNSSGLIQEQLKNVSKLVVTEGNFSEVFNYKNSSEIFGHLITVEKKALVVVNAKVSISYNLKQLKYEIDEATKTLKIISIPDYEVSINPDLEYYDVQADYLNPFKAEDYNSIKNTINEMLEKRIEKSTLVTNAQNRLLSELAKFYILTESLGWTLIYNDKSLQSEDQLNTLIPQSSL